MSIEKSQSLPESLTLSGVVYKVAEHPELKDFIGQIAKVEKSKLYSQIEDLRTQMDSLNKVQIETTPQPAPQVQQPQASITAEQIAEVVRSIVKQEIAPIQASVQQAQTETLEEYRDRLVKDNEHLCIPEMVKGNSREELLASLAESVKIRSRYNSADFNKPGGLESANVPADVALAAQQAQENAVVTQITQTPAQAPTPVATQAQPVAPVNTTVITPMAAPAITEDGGLNAVKSMTPEEFAANRKKLEEKLRTTVG